MTAGTLLEAVARARDNRTAANDALADAIRRAHGPFTWNEIAAVAGLSKHGCRYLALPLDERRRWNGQTPEPQRRKP